VLADGRGAEHGATLGPQRLAQRERRDDVVLTRQAGGVQQSPAAVAADPQRVGLVGHEHRLVPGTDVSELGHRGSVAEHGVDGLDQDDRACLGAAREEALDRPDVVVRHHLHGRAREPARIDHRGVHVRVGDDQRVAVGQGRHGGEVGVVARGQRERRREAGEVRQPALEVFVHAERARHQARGSRAGAVPPGSVDGRRDHVRMPTQPEVVVAGEVDHRPGRVAGEQAPGQARALPLSSPVVQPVGEPAHAVTSATAPTSAVAIVARSSSEVTYGGIV
jgi:hypothetical protein